MNARDVVGHRIVRVLREDDSGAHGVIRSGRGRVIGFLLDNGTIIVLGAHEGPDSPIPDATISRRRK